MAGKIPFLLALVLSANSILLAQGSCHPRPKDVVFVVDGSASVRECNFQKVKEALKTMVGILVPDGDQSTQIGLIQFGSAVTPEFALNQYNTKDDIDRAIDAIVYSQGSSTLTGAALKELHTSSFTPQNGARTSGDVKKIAIVITDGKATDKMDVEREQAKVKAAGIEVFAVGVGDSVGKAELNFIASEPTQTHVLEIESYSSINESLKSLTEEICVADTCSTLPLTPLYGRRNCNGTGKVGTICVFTCNTGFEMNGHAKTRCEMVNGEASWTAQAPTCTGKKVCHPRPMDIVFVLDGSRSVSLENFKKVKNAVRNMTSQFASIGNTSTEVGVIQFSTDVRQEFPLGKYQTKDSLDQTIGSILYTNGASTQTGLALEELVTKMFTTQNGARMTPDVAKIAIVITDGEPTNVQDAREWQQKVKDSGIEIFAVGVGSHLNENELRLMASEPKHTHTYKIGDFNEIHKLYSLLEQEICERGKKVPTVVVDELTGDKVRIRFPAVTGADVYYITINDSSSTSVAVRSCDVVNGYITKVFSLPTGIKYKISIVPEINGQRGVATIVIVYIEPQVSAVKVNQISSTEYQLKFKALDGASRYYIYIGSSLTPEVVESSEAVNGLITKTLTLSGNSSSYQIRIVPEFNGIKGVATVVTVQIKKAVLDVCTSLPLTPANGGRDCTGTGKIGTTCDFTCDPGFKMTGQAQTSCAMIGGQASWTSLPPTCTITLKEVCHARPMDIVFLLDGSRSVWLENFKKVKNAVRNMTSQIASIGNTSTEVGVIQFGADVRQEFPLGKYQTKESLDQAIGNILYMDGESTQTGLALEELVTKTFTTQNGARMTPDVAKIAIVITDGEPTNVQDAREWQQKVKESGIEIFAVGVGSDLNENELRLMASEPKDTHTYKIEDFNEIHRLHSLLEKEICGREKKVPTVVVDELTGDKVRIRFPAVAGADVYYITINDSSSTSVTVRSSEVVNGYITKVFSLPTGIKYKISIVPEINGQRGVATIVIVYIEPQVSAVKVNQISSTEYQLKFKALDGASRYYFYIGSSLTPEVVESSEAVNGLITKTLTLSGNSSSYQIRIVPEFNGIKGVATVVTVQIKKAVTKGRIRDVKVVALSGSRIQLRFRALASAEVYHISINGVLRATVDSSEVVNGYVKKEFGLQGGNKYVLDIVPVINGAKGSITRIQFVLRERVDRITFETVSDTKVKITLPFANGPSSTVYHVTVNDTSSSSAIIRSSDAVNGYATKTFILPTGYHYEFTIVPEINGRMMTPVTHKLLLGYCTMPRPPMNSYQRCLKQNGVMTCEYQCMRGTLIGPDTRKCRMGGGKEHWDTPDAPVCSK